MAFSKDRGHLSVPCSHSSVRRHTPHPERTRPLSPNRSHHQEFRLTIALLLPTEPQMGLFSGPVSTCWALLTGGLELQGLKLGQWFLSSHPCSSLRGYLCASPSEAAAQGGHAIGKGHAACGAWVQGSK